MSSLRLRNKLLLLALLPLVFILVLLMGLSYSVEQNALESNVTSFKNTLMAERKQQLKDEVDIGLGIIEYQLSLGDKGDVNTSLRNIRFSTAGYFFIYDFDGLNVFHAVNLKQEGTNQINKTDPNGTKTTIGLLEAARSGDGFSSYVIEKPGTSRLEPKISYSAVVPGKNWILGTGAYIDDIDAVVNEYKLQANQDMADKALLLFMLSIALIVVTAIGVVYIAHRMVAPIQSMANNLNDIAQGEGDLTKRLSVSGEDEIAQLGRSFNLFVDKLQGIISDVAAATSKVKEGAQSISGQTKAMAAQLVSHNNETDQVVTAITQMSSTANEVAQNTTQVAEATQAATGDVANAQACVDNSLTEISGLMAQINQAADSIKSLSEQSKKINSVLSVIGGIAEQTNLLALNAAIEAARAGEQGRGFAVVADEVRSLASRTQASTLEINEMLADLHKLVAQAVKAMDESQQSCVRSVDSSRAISESLGSVTSAVTAINDMSTQIATAATEQSSVTEEINRNVYAIQEIVNELLHSSDDAAKTSQTVSHEGVNLGKLVGQFKI